MNKLKWQIVGQTMQWQKEKGQQDKPIIDRTSHRKLKIEQCEPN